MTRKIEILLAGLAMSAACCLAAQADEISVAGRDRSYEIYRPDGLDRARPVPLVIMLHGGFGTGAQARRTYGWDDAAKAKGFVVAYPDGVRRSWNAGGDCCGPARRDAVDDVGFLTALIRKVSAEQTIDPARIYLTGISNGAAMAYRYACDGAVPVAAIASISGAMPGGCSNPHAVSVLEIHGLQDRNIPFAGGKGSKGVTGIDWPPVEAGLDAFRKADQCGAGERRAEGAVVTIRAACAMGRGGASHHHRGCPVINGPVRRPTGRWRSCCWMWIRPARRWMPRRWPGSFSRAIKGRDRGEPGGPLVSHAPPQ